MQILNLWGFRMTTMLLIQGVGSVTYAITPCSTNSSNFCFSSILSGRGTLWGLFWTSLTFLSICILYSPGSFPSPENTSLQLLRTPSLVSDLTSSRCLTHSTLKALSWSAELACPDNKDGELLSTTWKWTFFLMLFALHHSVTAPRGWRMELSYSFSFIWEGCKGAVWDVCSPQEQECCSLPQYQFWTWGLELSGLLRGIRGCLCSSVCGLTKGPRHRCFHHCWQVYCLRYRPLHLLAVYCLTVVDALGIGTSLQRGYTLSRLRRLIHRPDICLCHGLIHRICSPWYAPISVFFFLLFGHNAVFLLPIMSTCLSLCSVLRHISIVRFNVRTDSLRNLVRVFFLFVPITIRSRSNLSSNVLYLHVFFSFLS